MQGATKALNLRCHPLLLQHHRCCCDKIWANSLEILYLRITKWKTEAARNRTQIMNFSSVMEEDQLWSDNDIRSLLPDASLDYADFDAMIKNGSLVNYTEGKNHFH